MMKRYGKRILALVLSAAMTAACSFTGAAFADMISDDADNPGYIVDASENDEPVADAEPGYFCEDEEPEAYFENDTESTVEDIAEIPGNPEADEDPVTEDPFIEDSDESLCIPDDDSDRPYVEDSDEQGDESQENPEAADPDDAEEIVYTVSDEIPEEPDHTEPVEPADDEITDRSEEEPDERESLSDESPDSIVEDLSTGSEEESGLAGESQDTLFEDFTIINGVLTEYTGCDTEVVVPEGVTGIGDYAFRDCDWIMSITLPDSLTVIGRLAFLHCYMLTDISIPENVTSIGFGAFSHCQSLKSVTLPNSLTVISDYAFNDCQCLKEIELPDNLTVIGSNAFNSCGSLTDISIPESVTSIGPSAFERCSRLTGITIPDGVTSINDGTFSYCLNLSSLTIPDSVTSIGGWAFENCRSLINLTLPANLTAILNEAFKGCYSLTGISIPEGVNVIGDYAFINCTSLADVTLPDSLCTIGANPFVGCGSISLSLSPDHPFFSIIDGVMFSKLDNMLISCPNTKISYSIPEGTQSIGESAFSGCSSLTDLTLPDSLTSIGNSAFYGCSSLTGLVLPDCLTSISSGMFQGCSSLTNIALPDNVKLIGSYAFYDCSGLKNVTIPEGVERVEAYAFMHCCLGHIILPKSLRTVGEYAFNRCELKSVVMRDGVTFIGTEAFYNTFMTSITIPASVTSIGEDAICKNDMVVIHCPSDAERVISYANAYEIPYELIPDDLVGKIILFSEFIKGVSDKVYNGSEITQDNLFYSPGGSYDVREGRDYTVSYSDNVNVGTATVTLTGIGEYWGNVSRTFTIKPKNVSSVTIAAPTGQFYTGSEMTPALDVTWNGMQLVENVDYTVEYDNNIEVGTEAVAAITGIGNYTGTKSRTFSIMRRTVEDSTISAIEDQAYTGSAITPSFTVTCDTGVVLVENLDYTVTYSNNTKAGTATVTVTGIGNYKGILKGSFNIVDLRPSLSDAEIAAIPDKAYTGEKIVPALTVTYNGETLVQDRDYTAVITNNVAVGDKTAQVTITGAGEYVGKKTVKFSIVPRSLSKASITAIADKTYTGTAFTPTVKVTADTGKVLVRDRDFTVEFSDNVNAGTATVTVTGIGNYKNTLVGSFTILPKDMSAVAITSIAAQVYNGSPIKPSFTLTYGGKTLVKSKDFTYKYSNNTAAGSSTASVIITGKGNFTGTKTKLFTIARRSLEGAKIAPIPDKVYTGSAIRPNLKVTSDLGVVLTAGTDYKVSYTNNKLGGTAVATATGIGNYTGTVSRTFWIEPAVKSVTIPATLALKTMQTKTLTATVTMTDGSEYKGGITWASSLPTIARVSAKGVVTAVKVGSCTVTATADNGKKAACKVTVTARTALTGIKISRTALTLAKGKSSTLKVAFTPTNATIKTLTWASSNTAVATVTNKGVVDGEGNGLVKAVGKGTAVISATSKDGKFVVKCKVTVN